MPSKEESIRELIGNYTPEGFEKVLKGACAPAAFVGVRGGVFRGKDGAEVRVLGVVKDLPGENGYPAPLLVADVPLETVLTERSSRIRQFKLAREVLEACAERPPMELDGVVAQGIFAFHDREGHFRISLVTATPENGRFNWSKARRQSFYVTPEPEANATFVQRMGMDWSTLKGIKEAFSVEKLTKEFYDQLFKWYDRACEDERVEYPNGLETDADNREDKNRKHLLRLITRLMFVWFLKQKGLVPEALFDEEALGRILKDFKPTGRRQHQYYRAILQNLFFATLNSEIADRGFADDPKARARDGKAETKDHGIKTKYRYADAFAIPRREVVELFRPVPFLNGGLFECLDQEGEDGRVRYYDGFSMQERHRDLGTLTWAHVPNDLFFDPDYGLLPLLKRYNFTVEENSPGDEDVALDPELLGKVFENLLGAYNPETQEIVRNSTGSFYTPREIVNYMVDEALVAHLAGRTGAAVGTVRALVADGVRPEDGALCRRLAEAIETTKVLDPACGSGAFPMGALLKMAELLRILKKLPEDANLYDLKLQLIENCIFGSDIQEIAVQIAKLRVFISLVCEQKPDWNKPNYGINTLPNLETKYVAANSIVGLKKRPKAFTKKDQSADLFFEYGPIQATKDALWKVRHLHFLAKTRAEKDKLRLRDKNLRGELATAAKLLGYSEESTQLMAEWDPYNQNVHAEFFDPEWMFNIKNGFDIVIGNPPYIKEYENRSAFDGFREQSPYYMGKMDIWHGFACKGLDFLSNGGVLCFIAQNNWTTNAGAKKMRNKVLADARIVLLLDFNDYMVFDAGIQTMIMLFQKASRPEKYTFKLRTLRLKASKEDFLEMLANPQAAAVMNFSPTIDRAKQMGKLLSFSAEGPIFERIAKGKAYLSAEEATNGIHTHHDCVSRKINLAHPDLPVGKGIFVLSASELRQLSLGSKDMSLIKPFFTSDEVQRYFTSRPNKLWIIYTDSSFRDISKMRLFPEIKKHLDSVKKAITSDNRPYGLHRAREEHFFQGEKIVSLRKCVGRPLFSYSDFDCYVPAMFYVIQTSRWSLKFLTGVLNSRLVAFWLRNKGKMQGGNYQVDKEPLLGIPLPKATIEEQAPIISLVDRILSAKTRDPSADTASLEGEIDALVYDLYGLTAEERAIVEGVGGAVAEGAEGGRTGGVPPGRAIQHPLPPSTGGKKKVRAPKIEEEF